jgi:hypothetical protein
LWERVLTHEVAKRVRGMNISLKCPLTRFLAALETTLSHKGRGKKEQR